MARASYLLPKVFVGCPYSGKFAFQSFKDSLNRLPFVWYYADTHLKSKHLLSILTTYIESVDFCIFDLSFWNPNVALELGLAEGLGKDYYILVNEKQSGDVPSDIKGLQRIEYSSVKGLDSKGLLPNLVRYLVSSQTHPRRIWENLSGTNKDKKFLFALGVLAHFRDNKNCSQSDILRLSKGLYLRKEAQDEIIELLEDQGVISRGRTRRGSRLLKRLYPPALRFK